MLKTIESTVIDDRNACFDCVHLTYTRSCRKASKYFVAWIDSKWLDKLHRCANFSKNKT